VISLDWFAVFHKSRNSPRHQGFGRVHDGLFLVCAEDAEAARRVVSDQMATAFNDAVVVPLVMRSREGLALEFWYEAPTKPRLAA
jgi:hypothetical protein